LAAKIAAKCNGRKQHNFEHEPTPIFFCYRNSTLPVFPKFGIWDSGLGIVIPGLDWESRLVKARISAFAEMTVKERILIFPCASAVENIFFLSGSTKD